MASLFDSERLKNDRLALLVHVLVLPLYMYSCRAVVLIQARRIRSTCSWMDVRQSLCDCAVRAQCKNVIYLLSTSRPYVVLVLHVLRRRLDPVVYM